MIRLTWLQFRAQAVTAAAALAALAVLLAATGPHLASRYAASGLSSCQGTSCENLASTYLQEIKADGAGWLYLISVAGILLAPALIGLFWGAPLIAHELETGTSALAWTQSVTRTRRLAVRLHRRRPGRHGRHRGDEARRRPGGRRRSAGQLAMAATAPASRASTAGWFSPPTASPRSATPRSPSPSASPSAR